MEKGDIFKKSYHINDGFLECISALAEPDDKIILYVDYTPSDNSHTKQIYREQCVQRGLIDEGILQDDTRFPYGKGNNNGGNQLKGIRAELEEIVRKGLKEFTVNLRNMYLTRGGEIGIEIMLRALEDRKRIAEILRDKRFYLVGGTIDTRYAFHIIRKRVRFYDDIPKRIGESRWHMT